MNRRQFILTALTAIIAPFVNGKANGKRIRYSASFHLREENELPSWADPDEWVLCQPQKPNAAQP